MMCSSDELDRTVYALEFIFERKDIEGANAQHECPDRNNLALLRHLSEPASIASLGNVAL